MQDTSRKRALSGLLACGATRTEGPGKGSLCGATLISQPLHGVPSMICSQQATGGCGHLRINYEPVEHLVTRLLIARLDGPEMRNALATQNADTSAQEADLRRELAADRRRLQSLEDKLIDELLTEAAYRRQRDRLHARIEHVRSELARLIGQRSQVLSGSDLADRLEQANVEQRRALYSIFIERVTIHPHPAGVPTHVTRKKIENQEQYSSRLSRLREETLARRVSVIWRQL
jgi:hypothetical protein